MTTVPPTNPPGDWRATLNMEDRKKVIEKVTGVLRELATDQKNDESKLLTLATKFEEAVHKQAGTISEYFHMIASRMVNLKTKNTKKPVQSNISMPTTMNMGQLLGKNGIPNNGMTQNGMAADISMKNTGQNLVMGQDQMGAVPMMQSAGNFPINKMQMYAAHPQQNNPKQMVPQSNNNNIPQNVGHPFYTGVPMVQGLNMGIPTNINGMPIQMPTQLQVQDNMKNVINTPDAERKYWEKLRSLQHYIKPAAAMIEQLDRLLARENGATLQEKHLQQIKKKLEYIHELLQETPSTRKTNTPYEEGVKVLEAAERQIQHWLHQLSLNKNTSPLPPQGKVASPVPTSSPLQQPSPVTTNQTGAMQGNLSANVNKMMLNKMNAQAALHNGLALQPNQTLMTNQMSQLQMHNVSSMGNQSNVPMGMINTQGPTNISNGNFMGVQHTPTMGNHISPQNTMNTNKNDPINVDDSKGFDMGAPEMIPVETVKEDEPKNGLQVLMSKVNKLEQQDAKDVSSLFDNLYNTNNPTQSNNGPPMLMQHNQLLLQQQQQMQHAASNISNNGFGFYQTGPNPMQNMWGYSEFMYDQRGMPMQYQQQQQQSHADKHPMQFESTEVPKKRKLNGVDNGAFEHNNFSSHNIMNDIRNEVARFAQNDSMFRPAVFLPNDNNTLELECNRMTSEACNLYITFETERGSPVSDITMPIVRYGTAENPQRFPMYIDMTVKKQIKESGYLNFLGPYKQYLERNMWLANDIDDIKSRNIECYKKETNDLKIVLEIVATTSGQRLKFVVPINYPEFPPTIELDPKDEQLFPEVKPNFENKLRLLARPQTVSAIVNIWLQAISTVLEVPVANEDEFVNSFFN